MPDSASPSASINWKPEMSQSSFSASASIKWRSPVKIGTIMFASVASLAAKHWQRGTCTRDGHAGAVRLLRHFDDVCRRVCSGIREEGLGHVIAFQSEAEGTELDPSPRSLAGHAAVCGTMSSLEMPATDTGFFIASRRNGSPSS